MKFAYFPGCKIPSYLPQYDISTRAVFDHLGITLTDIEFNCCGYPVRHRNFKASILAAARNMAIAKEHFVGIMTPCKCCYGHLRYAAYWLDKNETLRYEINTILAQEGLKWDKKTRVAHMLQVLANDFGVDKIRARVEKPLSNLKIAPQYGCHALRPSPVVKFDNPLAPVIFENLVDTTGANSVNWSLRLECCGNPMWEKNNRLAIRLMNKKIRDAAESGADAICTACTYCQIQFDQIQYDTNRYDGSQPDKKAESTEHKKPKKIMPAILFPQLLGKSFGLDEKQLGMEHNNTCASI